MKHVNSKILKFGLLIVFLSLFLLFLKNNFEKFYIIRNLSVTEVITLLALILVNTIIGALSYQIMLGWHNIKLSFRAWHGLSVLKRFANYILYNTGPVLNSLYLRRFYNLNFRSFLLISLTITLVGVLVNSFLGMLAAIFKLSSASGDNSLILLIIYFFMFVVSSLALFANKDRLLFVLLKLLRKVDEADSLRISFPPLSIIAGLIMVQVVMLMLSSVKLFLLFYFLSHPIPFTSSVLMTLNGELATLSSLTPAGIGVKEFIMSLTGAWLNFDFDTALIASALDRILVLGVLLVLSPFYFIYFLRFSRNCQQESKNPQVGKAKIPHLPEKEDWDAISIEGRNG